jgi:hypothetical protein
MNARRKFNNRVKSNQQRNRRIQFSNQKKKVKLEVKSTQ